MPGQVIKWKKEELFRSPPTTLAAIESLEIPLIQEVVFMADFRCPRCQLRVAEIMAKMNGKTHESVVISVVEKTVTLTLAACTYPNAVERRIIASLYHNSWSKISLFVRLFRSSCT